MDEPQLYRGGVLINVVADKYLERCTSVLSSLGGEKARLIASIGFSGIRRLGIRSKVDDDISLWLLKMLDTETMTLHTASADVLPIKNVDVNIVLGIPFEGEKVEDECNVSAEVMKEVRTKLLLNNTGDSISFQHLEFLVAKDYGNQMSAADEQTFKTAIVLYAMSYVLAVRGNTAQIPLGLLNNLVDTSRIGKVNWAAYLLKVIREAAIDVQNVAESGGSNFLVGGCMLFLKIFYIDNLDFGLHRVKHVYLPRVAAYSDEYLHTLVYMDSMPSSTGQFGSYGITEVLRRELVCYSRGFPSELFPHGRKKCLATFGEILTSAGAVLKAEMKEGISSFVEKTHDHIVAKLMNALKMAGLQDEFEEPNGTDQDGEESSDESTYLDPAEGAVCNVRKRFRSFRGCTSKRRAGMVKEVGSSRFSVSNLDGLEPTAGAKTHDSPADHALAPSEVITDLNRHDPANYNCVAAANGKSTVNPQSGFAVYKRREKTVNNKDCAGTSAVPFSLSSDQEQVQATMESASVDLSIVPYHNPNSCMVAAKTVLSFSDCTAVPSFYWYHISSASRRKSKVFFKELEAGTHLPFERVWFHHEKPWPIKMNGFDLREQFKRGGVFTVDLCDSLMRLHNELEHKTCGNSRRHWRCFLPATFAVTTLSGADYMNSKKIADLFIGPDMNFDFEHCRHVIAPVLIGERWSCYVWDLVAYDLRVLDPTMMNGTEEKAEERHRNTMGLLTEALVRCVNRFFDGWTLPEGGWDCRANTTISVRCRWKNSGIHTIHCAKWYGQNDLRKQITDVDLGEIRAEMLYQLLRMEENKGQLPALLVA